MDPRHYTLPIQKEHRFEKEMSDIVPCSDGTMLVQEKGADTISRYDAHFHKTWDRPVDLMRNEMGRYGLTTSPDEEMIGLHGRDGVRIYDQWGGLIYAKTYDPTHEAQTAEVYFSRRDLNGERFVWLLEPALDGGGFLHVLNAVDFSEVDRLQIDDVGYHWTFYATPDNDTAFINLSAGQDEAKLLKIKLSNGKITLENLEQNDDWVMGSFSPKSTEFVVAPHYDEPIQIYAYPHIRKIAEIPQKDLWRPPYQMPAEEDDCVNYWVRYIDEATLLTWTQFGRLLLVDRESKETIGEMHPEGCTPTKYEEIYEGGFTIIALTPHGELWLKHQSGAIRVYNLPHIAH